MLKNATLAVEVSRRRMIELLTTLIVTASSILLFGYWFRYTCLLILSAKTARDYAGQVVAANQLGFLAAQSELTTDAPNLDHLRDQLDHDYAVLNRLLKASPGDLFVENRMLGINYQVMGTLYRLNSRFSGVAARRALEEMAAVMAHMANAVGEHAACAAAA
jgi:hypothetical protein